MRCIFIFEAEDLVVAESPARAAARVEAIDVENGAFDFFADDGEVLLGTASDGTVSLTPTGRRRPEELRERLAAYLSNSAVGLSAVLADDPVTAGQAILDAEWARRPFRWFPWLDRRINGQLAPRL